MSLDEILILLLALATGVLLFVGLAQALEGRPRQRSVRRLPHLAGRRSFSAEERVLEHRARGARTGVGSRARNTSTCRRRLYGSSTPGAGGRIRNSTSRR